jgi:hypothetical protein
MATAQTEVARVGMPPRMILARHLDKDCAVNRLVACPHCGNAIGPNLVKCDTCAEALPAPVGGRTSAPRKRHMLVAWAAGLACLLAPFLLGYFFMNRAADQVTETVTIAQVYAHPEAHLIYAGGVQEATGAMTGTTTMHALTSASRCGNAGRQICHTVSGYAATIVNGGTVSRLIATSDGLSRVFAWYRHDLIGRGWTADPVRSDSTLTITPFHRNTGLVGSNQLETLHVYSGDPNQVTDFGGGAGSRPPRAHTLVATVYTLYPVGTDSVPW